MNAIGTLKLYAKDGLFYNEVLQVPQAFFTGSEFSFFSEFKWAGKAALLDKHEFIPVEVDGCTEYITGSFDLITQRNIAFDGRLDVAITIWLLVEEEI
ncbi:hypothetical protein [Aquimarina agarilytica]|uniref:hypothetical protein n=1 Tax=Aquimarina agarilytica TaxID=1087449 RepID=UPI0002887429|nr:hypothetical protein [Aquimarina agarilytica]